MISNDFELFRSAILAVFKKRNTKFLTTATILGEIRFQKAIYPKEDKERLDSILEKMREMGLVLTNQPKFVALTQTGQEAVKQLTEAQMQEIESAAEKRLSS
jgi:hypothetical protein